MRIIDKLSECEDKLLDPRTLSFRLKNQIRRKINDLLSRVHQDDRSSSSGGSDGGKLGVTLREILDRDEDQKHLLSYDDVSEIHRTLQRLDPTYELFFHELLDECRAVITDERANKELSDRLKKLQFDLGNKSYKEMTRAIIEPRSSSAAALDVASEVRQLRPVLITLLNSVLVIGGTFLFVFKAVEYSMTDPDVIIQVMASLSAATIVAIAELYFVVKII